MRNGCWPQKEVVYTAYTPADVDGWTDFFTEEGFYRITARENFDTGLPVGLVGCDGKRMLRDR